MMRLLHPVLRTEFAMTVNSQKSKVKSQKSKVNSQVSPITTHKSRFTIDDSPALVPRWARRACLAGRESRRACLAGRESRRAHNSLLTTLSSQL